ncbi:MAG: cytochrome b/b6 domain-containing protein [Hyphomicrobiaceae bacterium]
MQRGTPQAGTVTDTAEVHAWDLPTRLFHWSLVVLIAAAYVSRHWGDANLVWHIWNGYAILVLIVWRILWGVLGSSTSRFSSFVYGPISAARYAMDFLLRKPRHFLGHNPLGGIVVFLLLGLVGAMAVLGLFAYDDHDGFVGGPLSGRVSDAVWGFATRWHIRLFDFLLYAIGLHIVANILYVVWKRENLVRAMMTGRKPAKNYEDQSRARLASPWLAVSCLFLAIAIVFGAIIAAGGKVV